MARNLGRQFATIFERSSPKFALPNARSEFCPNSASRLIHSSTRLSQAQQQQHQDQRVKNGEAPIDRRVKDENEKEDDDVDVNKETGEVGGPEVPSPPATVIGNATVAAMTFELLSLFLHFFIWIVGLAGFRQ